MAHLHSNFHLYAVKGLRNEFQKTPPYHSSFRNQATRLKKNRGIDHCCSSATSSSSANQELSLESKEVTLIETYENTKVQFGCLVKDENWFVRRMVESDREIRQVAGVQAEAFHVPVFLFDDLFFDFFKAEVLAGLLYRLRNSSPDRYACLVASPKDEVQEEEIVGVADVTVNREDSVLQHLPGVKEYLYVSGIAVLNKFRRQKVATQLLKGCDILSGIWGFEYLVLRAYEDDYGARKVYSNAGYRVVSGDPPWMTSWIGRRRRVVMVKKI